ncbi:MAG: peroxiredoxin [Chloroherpetonaceae bacterium]|jgi:alkyl hydroperoxide reductase subunit AhpC
MGIFVGESAPKFKAAAVVGGNAANLNPDNAFKEISLDDYKGKWLVFFFYPADFTFVCPTEIEEFGKHYDEFKKINTEVLTCSVDSQFSHLAWRQNLPSLTNLPFPMLADSTHQIAKDYNVYRESAGHAVRGLFIIDPDGALRYYVVHPEEAGRSSAETMRVLQALQTGKMTPCNWEPGKPTL